jgi:hypothetical protein
MDWAAVIRKSYDNFVKRLGGLAQEVKEVVW